MDKKIDPDAQGLQMTCQKKKERKYLPALKNELRHQEKDSRTKSKREKIDKHYL